MLKLVFRSCSTCAENRYPCAKISSEISMHHHLDRSIFVFVTWGWFGGWNTVTWDRGFSASQNQCLLIYTFKPSVLRSISVLSFPTLQAVRWTPTYSNCRCCIRGGRNEGHASRKLMVPLLAILTVSELRLWSEVHLRFCTLSKWVGKIPLTGILPEPIPAFLVCMKVSDSTL